MEEGVALRRAPREAAGGLLVFSEDGAAADAEVDVSMGLTSGWGSTEGAGACASTPGASAAGADESMMAVMDVGVLRCSVADVS